MDDSLWHILRVKTGTETAVAASLPHFCYVPHVCELHHIRRQRKNVVRKSVMLPGFLFVNLVTPAEYKSFNSNVFGFLRNADRTPCILSRRAFKELRRVERENRMRPLKQEYKPKAVAVGDTIGVSLAFAMEAAMAEVMEIRGSRLLVKFVGSQLQVEISNETAIAA